MDALFSLPPQTHLSEPADLSSGPPERAQNPLPQFSATTSPACAPQSDPLTLTEGLNPPQREAVVHEGPPLLIVAGAGSGKTRVLTHRIAYVLATGRGRPSQILAITFTNKAAAEMRERVSALVGVASRSMWVATFHSACVRMLREQATSIGLKSSFSIYDGADSLRMVTLIAQELDIDVKRFTPRALLARISTLKDELVDPDQFASSVGPEAGNRGDFNRVLAQVYRRYQERLRASNALDFDDIIVTTVHMLAAFPHIADHYRRRFRHILVDEYQDTNHAQYVLVRSLAAPVTDGSMPGAELTVVGDADQSIYAFRGASIRNITEFEQDYPAARTILLEQNYRSTQNILTAANAVISRNAGRKPKRLWTAAGAGEPLTGYVADSEHDEARFIATEIDALADSAGVRPRDVAIFYRTNAQSRALEEVLIRVGLPYKVVGGTRFYERKEIKDALAYLRVLVNPDDDVSLRRILNTPKRGIGDRSEGAVAAYCETQRVSFATGLENLAEITTLPTRARTQLLAFRDLLAQLRELVADPAAALDAILDRTGYLAELRASDDPQDAQRVENLAELHAVAAEFATEEPEGTLVDFLERVSLVSDSDQLPENGEDSGAITLMTLHTAKGLEFPVVFLTGLEDGTFPHLRSLANDTELSEERRLAYVGLTRARQRLYVTRAGVRTSWGVPNEYAASRFLADIPEEVITWRRRESATQALRWGTGSPGTQTTSGYAGGGQYDGSHYGERGGTRRADGAAGGQYAKRGRAKSGPVRTSRAKDSAPSFGSATPRPAKAVPLLAVGDRVTHDAYGMGKVTALEGSGANTVAQVDFGSGGTKRLLLRFAPVTKL